MLIGAGSAAFSGRSAVPEGVRSEGFVAWLPWATTCAEALNQLTRPQEIAKRLESEQHDPQDDAQ